MANLLDALQAIRQLSKDRVRNSKHLSINTDALIQFARDNRSIQENNTVRTPITQTGLSFEEQIGLTLLFGSINYCYVDPYSNVDYSYIADKKEWRRSTGLLHALVSAKIPWGNFQELSAISEDQWRSTMYLDQTNTVLYDADERIRRLIEFSAYLASRVGSVEHFFDNFKSADSVYSLLIESALFDDAYLKRIQIVLLWLSDIAASFGKKFSISASQLTAMADYRLPQVMCSLNLIELSSDARKKLDTIIDDPSLEDDMRAAAIVVCEVLANEMHTSAAHLDELFWRLSQEMLIKGHAAVPAMRVATRCY